MVKKFKSKGHRIWLKYVMMINTEVNKSSTMMHRNSTNERKHDNIQNNEWPCTRHALMSTTQRSLKHNVGTTISREILIGSDTMLKLICVFIDKGNARIYSHCSYILRKALLSIQLLYNPNPNTTLLTLFSYSSFLFTIA